MLICQKTPGCQKLDGHRSPCEVRPPRPYTPTTEVVRGQYEITGNPEAFDRWLAEVRHQAWNEGEIAGYENAKGEDRGINNNYETNPYRAAALGLTAGQEGEEE